MNRKSILGLLVTTAVILIAGLLATQSQCAARRNESQRTAPKPPIPAKLDQLEEAKQGTGMQISEALIAGSNGFALKLYGQLRGRPGNQFFSPFSITTALAMADEGAKGDTAAEIEQVFGLPAAPAERRSAILAANKLLNPKQAKYQLSVANALWAQEQYRFLPEYTGALQEFYGSEAHNLDFVNAAESSRQTINSWVKQKTHDKIKELFAPSTIDSSTRLVLTNAIYFKGSWLDPFDKEATLDEPFRAPGGPVSVPMMRRSGHESRYAYTETDALQALELPYEGGELSMLVLLPKGDALEPLEAGLTLEQLSALRSQLRRQKVDLYLPKFTFSSSYSLNTELATLGMPTAFKPEADFSGMDGSRDLYIGLVVHKAFVDVGEEGTEAAAATGVAMVTSAAPSEETPPEFRADHPFLFFIQEADSGLVLFMGRVENPKAE